MYLFVCRFTYDVINMWSQDHNVGIHDIIGRCHKHNTIYKWHHNQCSHYSLTLFYLLSIQFAEVCNLRVHDFKIDYISICLHNNSRSYRFIFFGSVKLTFSEKRNFIIHVINSHDFKICWSFTYLDPTYPMPTLPILTSILCKIDKLLYYLQFQKYDYCTK